MCSGLHSCQRSEEAANYAADERRLGRVDFLFARRRYRLETDQLKPVGSNGWLNPVRMLAVE